MEKQMLIAEGNEATVKDIINGIVKSYFTQLIKEGTADNYSDVVIDLDICVDKEYLRAVNRLTKEVYMTLAEIRYTEKTFVVISKFLTNEKPINRAFTFYLN